ncbi:MAG: ArsR/SmtB family transcription factor [bacterium]
MPAETLNAIFAALAHPARRSILARLSRGQAGVLELAKPLKMSLPAVSRHIKVLERSGLIARGRNAQSRPCSLNVKPLTEAEAWIEAQRKDWGDRLDRLDQYLQELQKKTKENHNDRKS